MTTPATREEWQDEADMIALDLRDAKADLTDAIRDGATTAVREYEAEVRDLQRKHQYALRQISMLKRAHSKGPSAGHPDPLYWRSFKEAAKELLSGAEYARITARALEIAKGEVAA